MPIIRLFSMKISHLIPVTACLSVAVCDAQTQQNK